AGAADRAGHLSGGRVPACGASATSTERSTVQHGPAAQRANTATLGPDRPPGLTRSSSSRPTHSIPRASTATNSAPETRREDRKSTRLNSSHVSISYAVFCLKKKTKQNHRMVVHRI